MAFGFPKSGGNIVPRIKFNAKSGRMYRVERKKNARGDYESEDVEIANPTMLVHRASMRKGWMRFTDFAERMVNIYDEMPAQPEGLDSDGKPEWKPTVKWLVKLAPSCGGDVREWGVSAYCVMDTLEPLTDEWAKGEHATDDMCPILTMTGTVAIKGAKGTNYAPAWRTAGWRPCPPDLAEKAPQERDAPPGDDFDRVSVPANQAIDGDALWDAPAGEAAPGNGQADPDMLEDLDSSLPF